MLSQAALISDSSSTPLLKGVPFNLTRRLAAALEEGLRAWQKGMLYNASSQSQTLEAGGIQMTVGVLPFAASGQAAVPPPGLPLHGSISPSVMQKASQGQTLSNTSTFGFTSCRWKAMNPYGLTVNETDQSFPAQSSSSQVATPTNITGPLGDVVTLTMYSAGNKVEVQDLEEPLTLAIPIALAERRFTQDDMEQFLIQGFFPECRWWCSVMKSWKGSGCRVLQLRNDGTELLCACTHLTPFAPHLGPIGLLEQTLRDVVQFIVAQTVECAQATIFTQESLAALQDDLWVTRVSASTFFTLLVVTAAVLSLSGLRDIFNRKELRDTWAEMTEVSWFNLAKVLADFSKLLKSPYLWKYTFVRGAVEGITASSLGISQDTICVLEEAHFKRPGYHPDPAEAAGKSWFSLAGTVVKASDSLAQCKQQALDAFLLKGLPSSEEASSFKRIGWLARHGLVLFFRTFVAVHPIRSLLVTDLYTLVVHRAFVLGVQLLGSIFCSALWFHQSGSALSLRNAVECRSLRGSTIGEKIITAIPITIASTVVASGPSIILYNLVSARPRGQENSGSLSDAVLGVLFFFLGLGLSSWYLFYIAAFLANVSDEAANQWTACAACTILSSLLFSPLIQAAYTVVLAPCFLLKDATLSELVLAYQCEQPEEGAHTGGHVPQETRVVFIRPARSNLDDQQGLILPGQVQDFASVLPCQAGQRARPSQRPTEATPSHCADVYMEEM